MKRIAIAIAIAIGVTPMAFAEHLGANYSADSGHPYQRSRDGARVIESRPVYAASGSRQECWNPRAGHYEELRAPEKTSVGKGAAIGAVTGGVLGHQVGSGDGNTAATVGGALLGGLLGHQIEKRNDRDDQPDLDRSRCRYIAAGGDRLEGYDVRYEYGGREYVTRMANDPGRRLELGREINSDGTPF